MSDRSFLFVPGNRPVRFHKACASGADVVIDDRAAAATRVMPIIERARAILALVEGGRP